MDETPEEGSFMSLEPRIREYRSRGLEDLLCVLRALCGYSMNS